MTEFLKLSTGSNRIKIITNPFQYHSHGYVAKGNAHGFRLKCRSIFGPDACKLCIAHEQVYRRWLLGVLTYETAEIVPRILDIGTKVYLQLQEIARFSGNPINYQFDFFVDRKEIKVINLGEDKTVYPVDDDLKAQMLALVTPDQIGDMDLVEYERIE